VSQNKQYTWLLTVTSANLDRFMKSFNGEIPEEIFYTHTLQRFFSLLCFE